MLPLDVCYQSRGIKRDFALLAKVRSSKEESCFAFMAASRSSLVAACWCVLRECHTVLRYRV
jgi:hypothetical protein